MAKIFLTLFLTAFVCSNKGLALEHIIVNENILSPMVSQKINVMGKELYEKTGIFVAVAASESSDFESLKTKANELKAPFVLLLLSKSSHKVDILASKESLVFFDKNKVLSPYPGEGSILPLLSSPKGKDIYNAALLNGYADIIEQIAKYFNTELKNSIGNANRDTLNILRISIYGFICIALLFYFQRKITKKRLHNDRKS